MLFRGLRLSLRSKVRISSSSSEVEISESLSKLLNSKRVSSLFKIKSSSQSSFISFACKLVMHKLPPKTQIKYNKILSKFNFIAAIHLLQLSSYVRLIAFLNLFLGLVDWLGDRNRTPLPKTLLILIVCPLLNKLTISYTIFLHAFVLLFHANYNILSITSTLHYRHSSCLYTFTQLSSKHFLFKLLHHLDNSIQSDNSFLSFLSFLSTLTIVYEYAPQYTPHFIAINFFFYFILDHIHNYYQQYKVNLTGSWDIKAPKITGGD